MTTQQEEEGIPETPIPPVSTPGSSTSDQPSNPSTNAMNLRTDDPDFDPYFTHIISNILELSPTSVIYHQNEMTEILDLLTLSPKEIEEISGYHNGVLEKLSKKDARKLIHFKWYYNHLSSHKLNQTLSDDDIYLITAHDFNMFRRTKVPNMVSSPASTSSITPHQPGEVTSQDILSFQKSIKLEVSQYPEFHGALNQWLPFKRKLKAVIATHGLQRIIQETNPIIIPGTQDYLLYEKQSSFLYSVFTQKLNGGPATVALRAAEDLRDARQVYLSLVSHYESKSNLMVISQKCHSRIQGLKLTRNFRGGAQQFVTQLHNAFLDLEYCTGVPKQDLEKKTILMLAIEDTSFFAVRDNLAMDPTKSFLDCLSAIDQHATMFAINTDRANPQRKVNEMTQDQQVDHTPTQVSNTTQQPNQNEQPDKLVKLPGLDQDVWNQLPSAIKKFIADHNRKYKMATENGKTGNDSKQNKTKSTSINTTTTSTTESNNEPRKTATLRGILHDDDRHTNVLRTLKMVGTNTKDHECPQEDALIDSGADTTCFGPAFRVINTSPRTVNIVGYDDAISSSSLKIGDAVTTAVTSDGQRMLLRFNEGIINPTHKSILLSIK